MATAFKCDVCKNLFEGSPKGEVQVRIDESQVERYVRRNVPTLGSQGFSLCSGCWLRLEEVLLKPPPEKA